VLTGRCNHCGRPARFNLSAAVQTCGGCNRAIDLEPDVAARFARARDALLRMDVRKRQLSGRQRGAVAGSGGWLTLVIVMLVFVTLPFAGCSAFSIFGGNTHPADRAWIGFFFSLPLVVMVGVGAFVIAAFRRAERRLLEACVATPPLAPGESACCHVCGGPLQSGAMIARCGFCAADNVVALDVMARKQQHEGARVTDLEARIQREATSVGRTSGWLVLVTVAALVVVPFALFLGSVLVFFACRSWERPFDASIDYAAVATSRGLCIGRIDGSTVFMGASFAQNEKRLPLGQNARLHGGDLEGKRMRPVNSSVYAKVERVTSSPFYGNMATMQHPNAVGSRIELVDLCFEEN
jgi:hypothetical protein